MNKLFATKKKSTLPMPKEDTGGGNPPPKKPPTISRQEGLGGA